MIQRWQEPRASPGPYTERSSPLVRVVVRLRVRGPHRRELGQNAHSVLPCSQPAAAGELPALRFDPSAMTGTITPWYLASC